MHSTMISIFAIIICAQVAQCLQGNGGYDRDDYEYDDGKYRPRGDEGKYYHVGDGDRGPYYSRYGFGKYTGKYIPDPKGIYKRPVVTTPKYDEGGAKIIQQRHGFKNDAYHHYYETENGIFHVEQGKIINQGTEGETIHTNGFYEYTGTDGMLHRVEYSAGKHGFIAKAKRLPAPVTSNTPRAVHAIKVKELVPPPPSFKRPDTTTPTKDTTTTTEIIEKSTV